MQINRDRNLGFTLIELMVVIALVGIMMTLMTPSMRSTADRNKSGMASKDLKEVLVLARSMARTQQRIVHICGSADGEGCNAEGNIWNYLIVHIEATPNAAAVGANNRLAVRNFDRPSLTLEANVDYIGFDRFGKVGFPPNADQLTININLGSGTTESTPCTLTVPRSGLVEISGDGRCR